MLLLLFLQVLLLSSFCDATLSRLQRLQRTQLHHSRVRQAGDWSGEKRLFNELFANYSRDVRPRLNSSHTVEVYLELELRQIKDLEWVDEYLVWEPEDYDGVEELVVSPSKIWLPDLGIENSASHFFDEHYFYLFRAHVRHTGEVRWRFGGVMETSCDLDATLFPFDSQSCSIIVQSWAYSEAFVQLYNGSNCVHLEHFNDDDIWELIGTSARTLRIFSIDYEVPYAQVEFTVYLDRKPVFYVVNIIIPVLFLVVVVLMVYWLPADSGDKISLSITVLLAFSVLLFVVTDTIPASSDHTPVLGVFVTVTMAVSTVSVIESIIVMQLCSFQATKMPRAVRFLAFRVIGRALCVSRYSSPSKRQKSERRGESGDRDKHEAQSREVEKSLLHAQVDTQMSDDVKTSSSQLVDKINDVLVELRKITGRQEKDEMEAETAEEWRDLCNVLDRLLFFISLIVLLWVTVWMVVKSAQTPHERGVPPPDQFTD